ncbi:MAG: hypothetical protein OHM77_11135 [Candidatus Nitricoxidivorans perseverans]|uniref:Uncharacterized protein n=1 Tax=Candidatus Nitricoxidivorans perseverans TaxID=2975601 RepID=A0AA49FJX4_9PROT|nr:MAG: hypothetical protein OHM77_11135 [Candidatus Nitricoxidivorans perseverans]
MTLRRLRGRFGISAPRVAVRTHLPWHWRALAIAAIVTAALALAGWIYDAGRRFAGFDRSITEQEIGMLRDQVTQMEAEAIWLRSAVNASESKLQIERTALQQLTDQVSALEGENARLKEELAIFENLARGDDKAGEPTISRLHVEPDAVAGQYRYRFLVAQQGAQNGREFKGRLQIVATLRQGSGATIAVIPDPSDPEAVKYAVNFRSFRRLEGVFRTPAGAVVTSVEVRLVQEGNVKAAKRVSL